MSELSEPVLSSAGERTKASSSIQGSVIELLYSPKVGLDIPDASGMRVGNEDLYIVLARDEHL